MQFLKTPNWGSATMHFFCWRTVCKRSIKTRKTKLFKGTAHLPFMRFTILSTLCTFRMVVKIGIPNSRYEKQKETRATLGQGCFFSQIVKAMTTVIRQVLRKEICGCTIKLVESCVYRNVVVRVWVRLIKTIKTIKKGRESWCRALGVEG